ncbi:SDR family NAD(P)-dependent oxidoreductase [Micrococcaceae bacterium Sec5.8]
MTAQATTPAETTALITGATAGIGAEFARQLAAQGHNVLLVARDASRLQAKAEELEKKYGVRAEVLSADLADDAGVASVVARLSDPARPVEILVNNAGVASVVARLSDPARPVEILVNNAGIGLLRSFEENGIAEETKHLKLHVETAMRLTHAALQGMLDRRSGRIINVASVAAFVPRGSYSAAKSWLVSFCRWANLAYAKRGVRVTAVCPGFTHTEFHDRMGMDKTVTPRWMWLQAERVVREGLADNARGKAVSIPAKRYKVLTAAARVLPDRFVAGPPRRAK